MDGKNGEEAAMVQTQPVIMRYESGRKVMQLYVGRRRGSSEEGPQRPPLPLDPRVSLEAAGGELVAVMRFEGNATPQAALAARAKLIQALDADGLKLAAAEASGVFRVAQYGQIYTLTQRVNEVMLRVSTG